MTDIELCPICCEGELAAQSRMVSLECNDGTVKTEQRLHSCGICGTEIATADDLKFNARSARAAMLSQAGKLNGRAIYHVRKRLDITQEMAGKLFGGGPVAFCKYEKDDLTPSDAMDNLLWVAREFPFVTTALARRNGVTLGPAFSVRDSAPRITISPLTATQRDGLLTQVSTAIVNSHKSFAWGSAKAICNPQNTACNEFEFDLSLVG